VLSEHHGRGKGVTLVGDSFEVANQRPQSEDVENSSEQLEHADGQEG
jgi:hypothetical protein